MLIENFEYRELMINFTSKKEMIRLTFIRTTDFLITLTCPPNRFRFQYIGWYWFYKQQLSWSDLSQQNYVAIHHGCLFTFAKMQWPCLINSLLPHKIQLHECNWLQPSHKFYQYLQIFVMEIMLRTATFPSRWTLVKLFTLIYLVILSFYAISQMHTCLPNTAENWKTIKLELLLPII